MWTVFETRMAAKALDKAPREIRANYDAWLQIVRLEGPRGLRAIKGFHDEALKGHLAPSRSSRLSRKWRLIYRVDAASVTVEVVDVNAHDYR